MFATGDAAAEAREAGADLVGADDLAAQVEAGKFDFDVAIATPDMMPLVGRLGRALGPRGLMPNPKTGTVTNDVGRAVSEFKGGKVEYRTDRYGNVHVPLGKVSFEPSALETNFRAVLDELQRAKPAAAKGRYLQQDHGVVDDGPRRPHRHGPPAPRGRLTLLSVGIGRIGPIVKDRRITTSCAAAIRVQWHRGRWRPTSTTTSA